MKGQVTNDEGEKLANVTLNLHSTNALFKTGSSGEFEIASLLLNDTISFSSDGYQSLTQPIKATDFLKVSLKPLHADTIEKINYLSSITRMPINEKTKWTISGEDYSSIIDNPFVDTKGSKIDLLFWQYQQGFI